MTTSMRRVAIVTNNPAPYRIPVYNAILPDDTGIDLHVVFCTRREPHREWDLPVLDRPHYFLRERFTTFRGEYVHVNPDVFRCLASIHPDVVITTGFNPTHLLAVLYAIRHRCAHISMTDGTTQSEKTLLWMHRVLRRWVFKRSAAFLGTADASLDIYRSYGCPEAALFRSPLCIDNAAFAVRGATKRFDLLFCGRIAAVKNPMFALEVAQATAKLLGRRVAVGYVGSGPLEPAVRDRASSLSDVDVSFLGFASQKELPIRYAEARVLLLPSLWEPWGVVANEACASGVPVIASPHAGAAGELVCDGRTGFVRELAVGGWAEAAARLLTDAALYESLSRAARSLVAENFSFNRAAGGIVAAVRHATNRDSTAAPTAHPVASRPQ
jgi:glycosyltransferase involved in cell wall biosynthesis